MKYPGILKIGVNNPAAVKTLKRQLNLKTGSTLDANNGNFGESTKSVVQKFQKSKLLLDDGVVGDLTWQRLFVDDSIVSALPVSSQLMKRACQYMKQELHVREATGKNDGPRVEEYLKSVGLGKGFPWCMAFVFWAFEKAAADLKVKNPLVKTGGVLKQWNEADKKNKFTKPQQYDILIMDFGKGTGHTGMVTNIVGDRVHTIEGNTSADPTMPTQDREGNGVFERSRKTSTIKGFIRFT